MIHFSHLTKEQATNTVTSLLDNDYSVVEYVDEHGDYHVFVPNTDDYVELSKKLSDENIVVNRLSNVSTLASALAYPNGVQIKGSEYRYTLTPFVSPCYSTKSPVELDDQPTIAYKAMVEFNSIGGKSYLQWVVANADTPRKFEESVEEIVLLNYPDAIITINWDTYEPLGIDIVSGTCCTYITKSF